jgi:hypothetical protein
MGSINLYNTGGGFSGLLSDLEIDGDKEWGNYDITSIGTVQGIQGLFGGVQYTSINFNLAKNTLSCWQMDDNLLDDRVVDECGLNVGTSQRNTQEMHIVGHIGSGAFEFDGVNDYINIGVANNLNPGVSKSTTFWIRTSGTTSGVIYGGYDVVTWNGMGIGISMDPSALGSLNIWNDTNGTWESCTTNITDGEWHFVCILYNRGVINVYIDCVGDSDFGPDLWETTYDGEKYIGCDTTCNNLFSYDLDQLTFYDKLIEYYERSGMYNFGEGNKDYKGTFGSKHSCFGYDIYTFARYSGFNEPHDLVIDGKLEVNDISYFEENVYVRFGHYINTQEIRAINLWGFQIVDRDGDIIALFTDDNKVAIGDITAKTSLAVDGSCSLYNIDDAYYIGDLDTDNSWRIRIDGTDLHFERREAGSWISKGSFAA